MFEQSFTFSDIPRLFTLAFLEILLSSDNALVLAALTRSLPPPSRRKALFIGVASSFVLRGIALASIATLLKYAWIELAGAGYLLYLSVHYFLKKAKAPQSPIQYSFWKTVFLIELFDLLFALDSIIAGVAFIDNTSSKLWIVYTGGMIGLLGMRYAASLFSQLIDRFPRLETSAYLMVGWIGVKLAFSSLSYPLSPLLFWPPIAFFFLFGFLKRNQL
jgi:YkoY family integral membrane protein